MSDKKAVVLLSGGLDSATILAIAKSEGFDVSTLSFSYGQRHSVELDRAKLQASNQGVTDHRVADIDLRLFGGSALTDNINVPNPESIEDIGKEIPVTYVPARNTIFLSFALAFAETIGAYDIFIGVNALDYSGYPDCRPEFIEAFQNTANLATAVAVEGKGKFKIYTPLIDLTKGEIISKGLALGVKYEDTLSCYNPDAKGNSCGKCDSCILRQKGFAENDMQDPVAYQA